MKFLNLNNRSSQWILLIFVSFIWGASFILMKRGLESFSPVQVGSLRIFFASLFLIPFLFKRLKKFKKKDLKSLLIVAFIGNLFPALLFAKAQTQVSSSMAAMLNTLFPIIALITGSLFYGLKTERHKILGTLIGFAGAVGLVLGDNLNFSGENNFYSLYILAAIIFYAVSLNEIKYKLTDLDGITITIFSFAIIGPFAGISFLFTDFKSAFSAPGALQGLFYIALLALGGSAIAVTLFYHLTDYVGVVFASLITYIIPVFAIFWGLFDGEKISFLQFVFMGIIFFGVWLVNSNNKKTRPDRSL